MLERVLEDSFLMDGRTSLREYLHANPVVSAFVLPQSLLEGNSEEHPIPAATELHRWNFCPLLKAGPLAIYRGSESRPHAIRRALLQQGASHLGILQRSYRGAST